MSTDDILSKKDIAVQQMEVKENEVKKDSDCVEALGADSSDTGNILNKVKKIVAEQLGKEEKEVELESNFASDLGADSLDTVELVMALEEEFETEIPDEEAEKIITVQDAVNFIAENMNSEKEKPVDK